MPSAQTKSAPRSTGRSPDTARWKHTGSALTRKSTFSVTRIRQRPAGGRPASSAIRSSASAVATRATGMPNRTAAEREAAASRHQPAIFAACVLQRNARARSSPAAMSRERVSSDSRMEVSAAAISSGFPGSKSSAAPSPISPSDELFEQQHGTR